MRLDYCAGNRKTHAESGSLGRVEWVENMLSIPRRDPGARVSDTHSHLAIPVPLDSNLDYAGLPILFHRFDRVAREVQEHLLNLYAVDEHGRQAGRDGGFKPNGRAIALQLGELEGFGDKWTDFSSASFGVALLRHRP